MMSNEWVSVKERLPETVPNGASALVLTFSDRGNEYELDRMYIRRDGSRYWNHATQSRPVTHWMPLPAPPQ